MKILAINTAGKETILAIELDGKQYYKRVEFAKHSETLFPILEKTLSDIGLELKMLDYCACVSGPGSFTGVRIGMSVAKAFCYSLKIPLVTISTLELLAFGKKKEDRPVCAVINAGSGLVYHQMFDLSSKDSLYAPRVDTVKHLLGFLHANYNDYLYFVYNDNSEKVAIEDFGKNSPYSAEVLLKLSKEKIERKEFVDPVTAAPLYLRVSQAEQLLGKKSELRRASLDDIDDILALEGQNDEWDLSWNEIGIRQSFDNPSYRCFLYFIGDQAKGLVSTLMLGDEAEILRVVVENSVRLQGVASKMLSELFIKLKEEGCQKVFLEVNNQNYPALSLYQKLGFQEMNRREGYYGKGEDAILMKKDITN
ncbi:MAG: tRNA (adenosine(37)-N6)-threonylcarbamoyltransferase complex dimerization subunit type 1 TsaB [Clostridia bacterium]|nr:tRNA (adenosine(37)-N6)-threonylcarbamoyltransferase complex dimerization subunit type 1 TsaB [Clostridia bacterium]